MTTTTTTHTVWDHFNDPADAVDGGEPYTRRDIEDVWDKAFELGRDDGFEAGHEAGYEQGLDDGWGDAQPHPDDAADTREALTTLARILSGESVDDVTAVLPGSTVNRWKSYR